MTTLWQSVLVGAVSYAAPRAPICEGGCARGEWTSYLQVLDLISKIKGPRQGEATPHRPSVDNVCPPRRVLRESGSLLSQGVTPSTSAPNSTITVSSITAGGDDGRYEKVNRLVRAASVSDARAVGPPQEKRPLFAQRIRNLFTRVLRAVTPSFSTVANALTTDAFEAAAMTGMSWRL